MAHLDICLVYYVNKSGLACYDPLGSCFCCVAEMCGAQLGCLARCVNPFRQISIFVLLLAARWGWYSIRVVVPGGGGVQPGIKRSILIQYHWDDLSDVTEVPSLTLGVSSGPSHNMNRPGIFKWAHLPAPEVIALVYQRPTQFITSWGTGRIPLLIFSAWRWGQKGLCAEKVEANTATQRWNPTFINKGANLLSYQMTYPVLLYIRWPCGVK